MDTYAKLRLTNITIAKLQGMSESSVEYKNMQPRVENQYKVVGNTISDTLDKLRRFVASNDT